MEQESLFSERIVGMFDRAMNPGPESDIVDKDKLLEKLYTCIKTGLAAGWDDEQLVTKIKQIHFIKHIDHMRARP